MKTDKGDPFILNVTMQDHTLNAGFVFRIVVADDHGGYDIVTHGEGNALKQLVPCGESAAESTWKQSSEAIINNAQ